MKIRVKRNCTINQICWYILLFFGLFDSARNYTYLPFWFGYLKDGAIFLLMIFNLKNIKLSKVSEILFYVMFLIICVLSFQGFFYSRFNWAEVFIGIIKYMEFFFLILLFLNWDSIFSISMSKAVRQYVYIGVPVLIAVNVIGYYIPNPIVSRTIWNGKLAYGYYGGRITVGQPPIAIYPVIMAYIYLLIYDKNYKRLLVYLTAIIMAVSNTGLVAVFLVMAVILFYEEFINKERKLSRRYFYFLVIIIIGALLVFPLFKERFSQQWELYQKKIVAVLLGGEDASMAGREIHWKSAIQRVTGTGDELLGKGVYGFFDEINTSKVIENMYITIFCSYGWLGALVWAVFWLKLIYANVKGMVRTKNRGFLLAVCVILTYILHMYTLDTLICYMLSFAFAFFYALANKKTEEKYS